MVPSQTINAPLSSNLLPQSLILYRHAVSLPYGFGSRVTGNRRSPYIPGFKELSLVVTSRPSDPGMFGYKVGSLCFAVPKSPAAHALSLLTPPLKSRITPPEDYPDNTLKK